MTIILRKFDMKYFKNNGLFLILGENNSGKSFFIDHLIKNKLIIHGIILKDKFTKDKYYTYL